MCPTIMENPLCMHRYRLIHTDIDIYIERDIDIYRERDRHSIYIEREERKKRKKERKKRETNILNWVGLWRDLYFLMIYLFISFLHICIFPACYFCQRTYMVQGLVDGELNETWTHSCTYVSMCVCVCVCAYIYIYIIEENSANCHLAFMNLF